jgi:hypothetical protein
MRERLVAGRLEGAAGMVEVVGLLAEAPAAVVHLGVWGRIEADLALVPGLLLLRVLKALLLVILADKRSLLFIGLHELEPLSVFHRGLILDRLLMLLVVQSD